MVKVRPRGQVVIDETRTGKEEHAAKILQKMQSTSLENQAAERAKALNLPYIDLHIFPVDHGDIVLVKEADARKFNITLFSKKGKDVRVAALDALSEEAKTFIANLEQEQGWTIKLYIASQASLDRVWALYKKPLFLDYLDLLKVSMSGTDLEKFEKTFGDLLKLKHRITEIPTTEVFQTILAGAVKFDSSDIHLEPKEDKTIRLRYRIDGVLQEIGDLPKHIYPLLVSRIKMLGGMKLNIRMRAQDGHFPITFDNGAKKLDIRCSIIPGNHGESVVMRILDQSSILLQVEQLGLEGLAYDIVQKAIQKPTGMILTTGPTGSGKTTLLYALINKVNTPDTKIITVEDPIEYQIPGIVQTQVSKNQDYTFARGLRAIVRQDPDIILVGEIRDDETADIAINSALTGHLVLSTLHTNSASGSVPRLIEMGVKPTLIPPAVNTFIAQRLVRRLCEHCKESYEPAKETVGELKEILSLISPKSAVPIPKDVEKLYTAKGCAECNHTGFKGRIGIFEVLSITQNIEPLIAKMASEAEITKTALEDGMITMIQDGILKAVRGITSLDEVWRTTGMGEFLKEIYEMLMEQTLSRAFFVTKDVIDVVKENQKDLKKMAELIKTANQKEVLKYIYAEALLMEAGDIHLEPTKENVLVRFRLDGILQTICELPLNEYPSLLGQVKHLSALKTEVRAGVKDSRFGVQLEEPIKEGIPGRIDIRVSIILSGYGETVVMRLLNQGAVALELDKIGLRQETIDILLEAIKKPNGLVLNTGPTGSGKTTTLYSLLSILNKPEVKIITVEDPIEYQLSGILQTQVDTEDGYDFVSALRALLRQNPNIMMIGEIRDEETAKIAVQAALTGHLVLSTLHTNNAVGTIPRLLSFGIKPDDIVNCGNAFMAQRLVRRLCTHCKTQSAPDDKTLADIDKILKSFPPGKAPEMPKNWKMSKPKGCEKCSGTGYKGRIPLSEVLQLDKDTQIYIAQGKLAVEIQERAIGNGMMTMRHDGVIHVIAGNTTLEEVYRVTEG